MSRYGGTSAWTVIKGFFAGLIILAILACAGYGIYSAVDKYAIQPANAEQQEEQKEEQKQDEVQTTHFAQYASAIEEAC